MRNASTEPQARYEVYNFHTHLDDEEMAMRYKIKIKNRPKNKMMDGYQFQQKQPQHKSLLFLSTIRVKTARRRTLLLSTVASLCETRSSYRAKTFIFIISAFSPPPLLLLLFLCPLTHLHLLLLEHTLQLHRAHPSSADTARHLHSNSR